MSLYEEVKETGGYTANYESDLHIEVNETNKAILDRYPIHAANAEPFKNDVTGKWCYEVPFAYDPWWQANRATT
jgi:hypothetical protein